MELLEYPWLTLLQARSPGPLPQIYPGTVQVLGSTHRARTEPGDTKHFSMEGLRLLSTLHQELKVNSGG